MITSKCKKQFGFAILYAVLMVSIVLAISLTLLDISYKQLVLSSINKESKIAYYAADGALKCAIYWDRDAPSPNDQPFGFFVGTTFTAANKPIVCAGNSITPDNNTDTSERRISKFQITFTNGAYAEVTIIKGNASGSNGALAPRTLIQVNGYNTTIAGSRRVQRSLDATL